MKYVKPENDPRFKELVRLHREKKEAADKYDELNEELQASYGEINYVSVDGMVVSITKSERITYSPEAVSAFLPTPELLEVIKVQASKLPKYMKGVDMEKCIIEKMDVLVTNIRKDKNGGTGEIEVPEELPVPKKNVA